MRKLVILTSDPGLPLVTGTGQKRNIPETLHPPSHPQGTPPPGEAEFCGPYTGALDGDMGAMLAGREAVPSEFLGGWGEPGEKVRG